jgi:two-component system, chemotaxis family, sensor kinase CheA
MSDGFHRAREDFLSEAQELIDSLGGDLVAIDEFGSSPERINALFRHVHTLKGLTGLFGAASMSGLSHHLESLLEEARMGRVQVTSAVQQLLYRSVSLYGNLLAATQSGEPEPLGELDSLMNDLSVLRGAPGITEDLLAALDLDPALLGVLTEYEEHRLRTTINGGLHLFRARAIFALATIDTDLENFKLAARPLAEIITYLPMGDGGDPDSVALEILLTSDHEDEEMRAALASDNVHIARVENRGASNRPRNTGAAEAQPNTLDAQYRQQPNSAIGAIASAPGRSVHADEFAAANDFRSVTGAPSMGVHSGIKSISAQARGAAPSGAAPVQINYAASYDLDGESVALTGSDFLRALQPASEIPLQTRPETSLRSVVRTVRVDIRKLDHLMNIVGELSLVRGQLRAALDAARAAHIDTTTLKRFARVHRDMERELRALQSGVLEVRMVPLSQVFDKVSRVVRQAVHASTKRLALVITGGETELDKLIIEDLSDPLLHIMRNALDHGIELPNEREALGKPPVGTIAINAYSRGGHVVIELEDDGHGVDYRAVAEKAISAGHITRSEAADMSESALLDLLFLPGFSTKQAISELSGRGMGLDIVKSSLQKIGATIEVSSRPLTGTRFLLTLPLTLALVYWWSSAEAKPIAFHSRNSWKSPALRPTNLSASMARMCMHCASSPCA